VRIEIELGRHVDTSPVYLAAEQFLRQRRSVVGGVSFGTDHGERTVIAIKSQGLRRPYPGHAATHDDGLL
jgi:hypothetical protein